MCFLGVLCSASSEETEWPLQSTRKVWVGRIKPQVTGRCTSCTWHRDCIAYMASHAHPSPRRLLRPSRQGKLCLVLDLDHTLLNSATFSEVGPAVHAALEAQAAHEVATLPAGQRLLFRLDAIKVSREAVLVLRP